MLTLEENTYPSVNEFTEFKDSIEYLESLTTESYKHSMFTLSHPGRYDPEEIGKSIVRYNHLQRALDTMKSMRIPVNFNDIQDFFNTEHAVYVEYRDKSKKIKLRKAQRDVVKIHSCYLNPETDAFEEHMSHTLGDTIRISSKKKDKHVNILDYNRTYRFWMEMPARIELGFPWEYDERFDEVDDDDATD